MNENEIKKITAVDESTVNKIRRKTAYGLPDNPSAVGMKPAEIKRAFYESIVGQAISLFAEINRIVKEANEVFEAYEASNDEKLSQKLDVYKLGYDNVVYAVTEEGAQGYIRYESGSKPSTLMYRDSEGRSQINNPIREDDIANKRYVDTVLTNIDFIKIVDTLPETGEENKFYFVPKADEGIRDLFDEYVWVEGSWEWITTKQIEVDLTPYAKTEYVHDYAVSKITGTYNHKRAYIYDPNGQEKTLQIASWCTAETIPVRESNGCIKTGTPVHGNDAANKTYVDKIVGDVGTVLDAIIEQQKAIIAIQNSLIGGDSE